MLNKSFMELYDYDLSKYVRYRPDDKEKEFGYLPWNICIKLLHELGAEKVVFDPLFNESGHSIFMLESALGVEHDKTTKRKTEPTAPEVHVHVIVDDSECVTAYPVINGTEVIPLSRINQQLLNTARQRAFVKGVAQMTGLGLKLWEKADDDDHTARGTDLTSHSIIACIQRVNIKLAEKFRAFGESETLRRIGVNKKQIESIMDHAKALNTLEEKLNQL